MQFVDLPPHGALTDAYELVSPIGRSFSSGLLFTASSAPDACKLLPTWSCAALLLARLWTRPLPRPHRVRSLVLFYAIFTPSRFALLLFFHYWQAHTSCNHLFSRADTPGPLSVLVSSTGPAVRIQRSRPRPGLYAPQCHFAHASFVHEASTWHISSDYVD